MKKFTLSLLCALILVAGFAQAPQAFNYQAIARDNAGNVLANQNVTFIVSILQGNLQGEAQIVLIMLLQPLSLFVARMDRYAPRKILFYTRAGIAAEIVALVGVGVGGPGGLVALVVDVVGQWVRLLGQRIHM